MTVLAIDPGINGAGVAWFSPVGGGTLEWARYYPNALGTKNTLAERVAALGRLISNNAPPMTIVTECPQIYPAGHGKGDPNQLIPLAQLGAYVAARFGASRWVQVRPREWKGTLDGDVMVERIKHRLTAEEAIRVESFKRGGLDHNIYDGVGLGLWFLGRLTPRRIYAR